MNEHKSFHVAAEDYHEWFRTGLAPNEVFYSSVPEGTGHRVTVIVDPWQPPLVGDHARR